jgi:hypothetical protein
MARRWEYMKESEKQEIRNQIEFQTFLDEVADLEYEAFVKGIDMISLKQQLLDDYTYSLSLE